MQDKVFYSKRLEKFGPTSKAVGWYNEETQTKRFEVLATLFLEEPNLLDKTVLDIGCGLGDFYHFLKCEELSINYVGIDHNPQLIEAAQNAYPSGDFRCMDFSEVDILYDFCVASGCFSLKCSNQSLINQVKNMHRLSIHGFAFNLLNKHQEQILDIKSPDFHYFSPEDVLKKLQSLNLNPKLLQGYLPNDFTVICAKE